MKKKSIYTIIKKISDVQCLFIIQKMVGEFMIKNSYHEF